MRTCIVGEAPGANGDPSRPLAAKPGTGAGARLCRIAGMSHDVLSRCFTLRNLLDAFPGRTRGKGAAFPMKEARAAADAFEVEEDLLVLLGRRVGAAFGVSAGYFKFVDRGGRRLVVVPHPSGVNRWYNDEENRRRARKFFRELAMLSGEK